VLELRYGLGGGPAMTLKQIGEELHVTREWVRKLEIKAMRHIAEAMREVRVHAGHAEPYPLARTA
jgi:DNA-directed RNA polymerase sigma subunit (sigma70/sigma32)